jgi:hypothetical protein
VLSLACEYMNFSLTDSQLFLFINTQVDTERRGGNEYYHGLSVTKRARKRVITSNVDRVHFIIIYTGPLPTEEPVVTTDRSHSPKLRIISRRQTIQDTSLVDSVAVHIVVRPGAPVSGHPSGLGLRVE